MSVTKLPVPETLQGRLKRELRDFDPVVRLAHLAVRLEAAAFREVEAASGESVWHMQDETAAQLAVAALAKVAAYVHPTPTAPAKEQQPQVNEYASEASRKLIERIDRITDAVRGSGVPLARLVEQCETAADRAER